MKRHCRSLSTILQCSAGAAAVLSALSTQAAVLGHSRVTSLPEQPLQIAVQIKELSPTEINTLTATIAPLSAWQEAGLTAPVDLSSFRLKTITTAQPNGLQLLLESTQIASNPVIDVLVDIKTDVSTQRHQVSVLQAPKPTPVALARAEAQINPVRANQTQAPSVTATATHLKKHRVKSGQSVSHIARQYKVNGYSDQQFMAALLQANPQAFIHGNLNLIRAGAELLIPDAHQIEAVTPQQAGQLYQAHLAWFDEYRQRLALGQPIQPMSETSSAALLTTQQEPVAASPQTDRLQLSASDQAALKSDQAIALGQELAYETERLAELEGAIDSVGPRVSQTDPRQLGQNETEPVPVAASQTPISAPLASSLQGSEANADSLSPETSSQQAETSERGFGLWFGLGLLVLVALAIIAFLRRSNTSRLDVVDELPPSATRIREKLDKNTDTTAPQMDDVEFREIK